MMTTAHFMTQFVADYLEILMFALCAMIALAAEK